MKEMFIAEAVFALYITIGALMTTFVEEIWDSSPFLWLPNLIRSKVQKKKDENASCELLEKQLEMLSNSRKETKKMMNDVYKEVFEGNYEIDKMIDKMEDYIEIRPFDPSTWGNMMSASRGDITMDKNGISINASELNGKITLDNSGITISSTNLITSVPIDCCVTDICTSSSKQEKSPTKPFICPLCNGNSYTEKNGHIYCDYCGTKFI